VYSLNLISARYVLCVAGFLGWLEVRAQIIGVRSQLVRLRAEIMKVRAQLFENREQKPFSITQLVFTTMHF